MTARRRFYKDVAVSDDLAVMLDGRRVKTPMKAPLVLPSQPLAEAVAAEWEAQGESIDPAAMILTRLANTAIDRMATGRDRIETEIVEYASSDLVCYRAEGPEALVARQSAAWNPVVDWALTGLDASIDVMIGVMHRPQRPEALAAVALALHRLTDFELAAQHSLTTLTGSALLGLMLAHRAIDAETAWAAVHVDEDYQIEFWGEDEEAAERRALRRQEFSACVRFLHLARPQG
ncbi:MAG: ATPase [Alphaproteobacteria bacterium]|nr:ATPase [Alphaproteobacteria bacterium]